MPAEELSYHDGPAAYGPEPGSNKKLVQDGAESPVTDKLLFTNIIKVIAIGGGGGNALNHIISRGIEGVDMLAVNTDIRSLDMSLCDNKIVLGESVTKGLGAGAMPEIGAQAAMESLNDIRAYLKGSDMVYLTAGMGGGTGTGAIPIVARAAKDMGILTVAVVTKPFSFEGRRRARYAEEGIKKLFPEVDALIVVPNDRLLDLAHKNTPITESFSLADEILRQAVQGVTDLVTRPGLVNVDFADLKSVMKSAGHSVMGIGVGSGEEAVIKAVKNALESPLMECSMHGAKGVLMNVTYKGELPLYEVSRAAEIIEDVKSEDSNFIWGCINDETIANDVEVTLVAAGFDDQTDSRQPQVQHETERKQTPPTYSTERTAKAPTAETQSNPAPSADTAEPEAVEAPRRVMPECHAPDWLREDNSAEADKRAADNKKPTSAQKTSVYDVYERPAFSRMGHKLKMPD